MTYKEKYGPLPKHILSAETAVVVYTDGSCSNNGRRNACAGYGVFFGKGSEYSTLGPVPGRQTSGRAEMMAVITAMKESFEHWLVSPSKGLLIMTDSQVCQHQQLCSLFLLSQF